MVMDLLIGQSALRIAKEGIVIFWRRFVRSCCKRGNCKSRKLDQKSYFAFFIFSTKIISASSRPR